MKKILLTAGLVAMPLLARAEPLFVIPAGDVTQLKADFVTAGGVIMGLAVLFMAYRFIKRLIK